MKKYTFLIGMVLIYFAIVLACEFLGFFSPFLWVYFGVFASVLAATPVMAAIVKFNKIGMIAIFPIFYLVVMLLLGEASRLAVVSSVVAVSIIAEVVRKVVGYKKQLSARLGYALIAVSHGMYLLPLWINTDWYYKGAIEEMGSKAYADGLMNFATPLGLVALIFFCFVAGYAGAIISEKLFKDAVKVES